MVLLLGIWHSNITLLAVVLELVEGVVVIVVVTAAAAAVVIVISFFFARSADKQ